MIHEKICDSSLNLVLSRMVVWSTVPDECPVWFDARKNKNIECMTNCYIISKSHKKYLKISLIWEKFNDSSFRLCPLKNEEKVNFQQ